MFVCLLTFTRKEEKNKIVFLAFNDDDFVDFLERAADCVWKILAERARIKLDDQLRENQQVNCCFNNPFKTHYSFP